MVPNVNTEGKSYSFRNSLDTLMVQLADWSLEEPLTLAERGALPPP